MRRKRTALRKSMKFIRLTCAAAVVAIAALAPGEPVAAQESQAVAHAARVLDLLDAGRFDEVAAEFNAKVAAAMTTQRLREVWTTVGQQTGLRQSIISQRVVTQPTGNVTVVNRCQFERAV